MLINKKKLIICSLIYLISFSSCSRTRIQGTNHSSSVTSEQNSSNNTSNDTNSENAIGSNGGEVAIVEGEFEGILREGIGELYPCQYVDVYYEKVEDYKTCGSSSIINSLILASGGQNIGGYVLNAESLTIDANWIKGYNPSFMIKCVNKDVLGKNITDLSKAKQIINEIRNRDSWNQLEMIQTNSIILFSEELLDTNEGKMAFKLFIAKAMYPILFSNLDIDETIRKIMNDNSYYFYYYN